MGKSKRIDKGRIMKFAIRRTSINWIIIEEITGDIVERCHNFVTARHILQRLNGGEDVL
jgi:hypothetical protein